MSSNAVTVEALTAQLKQTKTIAEFQHIQCILMRATTDCSASRIRQVLGWAMATVHIKHSRWARQGEASFQLKGKGGRCCQSLTGQEEGEVLAPLQATAGNVLKVADIQAACEARIARRCPTSTIDRMLKRRGWRKLTPQPQHPEVDVTARGAFKETSADSSNKKSVSKGLASVLSK